MAHNFREFCSPLWLQLLGKLIRADSDPACDDPSCSLVAQLQAIELLRALLPEWTGTADQQKECLNQLIDILAEHVMLSKPDVVLEMAHADNRPSSGDYREAIAFLWSNLETENNDFNFRFGYTNTKSSLNLLL